VAKLNKLSLNKESNVFSSNVLAVAFIILVIQGFTRILFNIEFPIAPAFILDLAILAIASKNWTRPNGTFRFFSVLFISFFLLYITISVIYGNSLTESIKASKWIAYIGIFLGVSIEGNIQMTSKILKLTKLLSFFIFLAYFTQVAIQNNTSRPFLLTENNYELALLCMLYLINILYLDNKSYARFRKWIVILVVIAVLSASKSGNISLLVVLTGFVYRERKDGKVTGIQIFGLTFLGFISIYLLSATRGLELTGTDRERFFNLFLREFSERSVFTNTFGNGALQPLSSDNCSSLLYFALQLLPDSNGLCYSVVYHSFILRVLIDFGFFGLLVCLASLTAIYWEKCRDQSVYFFLAIIFVNSVSVSGVNNPYVALPTLLLLVFVSTSQYKSRKSLEGS
jgi:hypothetical protein